VSSGPEEDSRWVYCKKYSSNASASMKLKIPMFTIAR
jgi:hypothetical protein